MKTTCCPKCKQTVEVKFNKNCGPFGDLAGHKANGERCMESRQPVHAEAA